MNSEVEIAGAVLGSNLFTSIVSIYFSKRLGKKREDIETALKYQEFYQKHIGDLRKEIEELTEKVNKLIEQDNEKTNTIEEQRANLLRWENNCQRLEDIIKSERKKNAELMEALEKLEKR